MSAGWKATDEVAEQLKKLTLQQAEDRKQQAEDRKQQAERDAQLQLHLAALQAELNRASQTSQAEDDIGKVCFLQMLFCPSCPHALVAPGCKAQGHLFVGAYCRLLLITRVCLRLMQTSMCCSLQSLHAHWPPPPAIWPGSRAIVSCCAVLRPTSSGGNAHLPGGAR